MEFGFIKPGDRTYARMLRSVLATQNIQRDNEPGWLPLFVEHQNLVKNEQCRAQDKQKQPKH
jgi:hypothetical protein